MATNLIDLIDKINADDLPTNEFTIEDKDPMVILGKLNEVIAYLQTLQATINASDSKANEALQKAIEAVADATQALSVANGIDAKATQALANAIEAVSTANTSLSASNTALSTANTAISTANTALSSANSAVETAENALGTAESAETKADTAITTANGAKTTAEGIDAKATTALSNSQTAVSTANTADTKATQALATANTANTTANTANDTANTANDTANTANDTANTALANSSNALTTSNEASSKATTALNNANNAINIANGADTKADTAITTANEAKSTANEALDQVVAGLGTKVYRDSQLLTTLDIKPIEDNIANNTTAINNEVTTRANAVNALDNAKVDKVAGKQLSTEDFTTTEKNKLAGLNNYDDTQVQADITALQNADNTLSAQINGIIDKIYPIGSIYMSMNNTSPQTFIGGTWERIQDRFLLSAGSTYSAGTTGGEANHTLTINEMPSHNHGYEGFENTTQSTSLTESQIPSHTHKVATLNNGYSGNITNFYNGNAKAFGGMENDGSVTYVTNSKKSGYQLLQSTGSGSGHNHAINSLGKYTENAGGNTAHNNMPPYLAVYMWKRTA